MLIVRKSIHSSKGCQKLLLSEIQSIRKNIKKWRKERIPFSSNISRQHLTGEASFYAQQHKRIMTQVWRRKGSSTPEFALVLTSHALCNSQPASQPTFRFTWDSLLSLKSPVCVQSLRLDLLSSDHLIICVRNKCTINNTLYQRTHTSFLYRDIFSSFPKSLHFSFRAYHTVKERTSVCSVTESGLFFKERNPEGNPSAPLSGVVTVTVARSNCCLL